MNLLASGGDWGTDGFPYFVPNWPTAIVAVVVVIAVAWVIVAFIKEW